VAETLIKRRGASEPRWSKVRV